MANTFLTAEWRKIIMANYAIDPLILKPYLPGGTKLDFWENRCYVSLVGFLFDRVKLKGLPIPFHTRFEEVNLRFYVQYFDGTAWKRGVVFISEMVPLPAISLVANWVYGEKYSTLPMSHTWETNGEKQIIRYEWEKNRKPFFLEVHAGKEPRDMAAGSEEQFIFEHYWGFTSRRKGQTGVYQVEHPSWKTYVIQQYNIQADFESLYGPAFRPLNAQLPDSVFLAEGSPVRIFMGGVL